jgi:hypothetical protein
VEKKYYSKGRWGNKVSERAKRIELEEEEEDGKLKEKSQKTEIPAQ